MSPVPRTRDRRSSRRLRTNSPDGWLPAARRLIAATLMAALALVGQAIGAAAIAQAADSASPSAAAMVPRTATGQPVVQVIIDKFTPVLPQRGDTITMHGRLINTSSVDLTGVTMSVSLASTPLTGRDQVSQVSTDPSAPLPAAPLFGASALINARTQSTTTIGAGGEGSFTITMTGRQLPITEAGAYPMAITARGLRQGLDSTGIALGRTATFITWYPTGTPVAPIHPVWLWPLVDRPDRNAAGTFMSTTTPSAVAVGGRLWNLVTVGAAHRSVVSWIADPALLQAVASMRHGYRVIDHGQTIAGDQQRAAAAWLGELGESSTELRLLPYADIDAAALQHQHLSANVVAALTNASAIAAAAAVPGTAGMYWSPSLHLPTATANLLQSSGVTTAVIGSAPSTGDTTIDPLADIGTSGGSITAVIADAQLSAEESVDTLAPGRAVLARQQLLADTLVLAQHGHFSSSDRTVVIAPTSLVWNPAPEFIDPVLRATSAAPWLASTSLAQLLGQVTVATPRMRTSGHTGAAAVLPASHMSKIAASQHALSPLAQILANPAAITQPYVQALLRSSSATWAGAPIAGNHLVDAIADELATSTASVSALSATHVSFSGDSGPVPITIDNELNQPVTVSVRLIGMPTTRLVASPGSLITVPAGHRSSVTIAARVVGADPVHTRVELLTPTGQVYADRTVITLSSASYARAAGWVVLGAFIALALFVVFGVTRRIMKVQRATSSDA